MSLDLSPDEEANPEVELAKQIALMARSLDGLGASVLFTDLASDQAYDMLDYIARAVTKDGSAAGVSNYAKCFVEHLANLILGRFDPAAGDVAKEREKMDRITGNLVDALYVLFEKSKKHARVRDVGEAPQEGSVAP